MTELAVPEQRNQLATREPDEPSDLMKWVEDARQANLVAKSLATTNFAGAFKGKPDELTAAILAGQELGLKPMASLKSIDIIQGTPALRAHAMRAIVQGHGHEIELVESTNTYCKMRGRRKGAETWQYVEWDIPRAQALGLLTKDQWKKQPKTMLIARATGELSRLIASDALHGLPHAAEEIDGYTSGEILPARAPLSVAQLTAPVPVAEPATQATEIEDGVWDTEAAEDSVDWPETAQPGGAA
ncbi:hypothetical protein AB0M92_18790 [Streptomyces sp. NPDC051582]|uniref:hypothetical protein n=1 Tax=Streptomyces sp. NPDC051582 TaxID=3155167 RepID=UPI003444DCE1